MDKKINIPELITFVMVCLAGVGLIAIVVNFPSHPSQVETQVTEPVVETVGAVEELAKANGYTPSKRVVNAIMAAALRYDIASEELTAIAILETGLGKNATVRHNRNGTTDKGLFQINSVNYSKCLEYNLDSPEGSAMCAAKLLKELKDKRTDYLGAYHSKTPSKKLVYMNKLNKVLVANVE